MRDILRILIAPLVWLAAFSAVYGLHGLLCGHGIEGTVAGVPLRRTLLVGAYIAVVLIQVMLLLALYSARYGSPSPFARFVSRATGWVGLIAALWSLLPVTATSYCP